VVPKDPSALMLQPSKFGKYLLLERIAVGGMAEVFVAKAFGVEGFERLLAIKKILPTMSEEQEFVTMFVDEARIAVQLAHANIVQVLELGKHDDNLFIAMEYISGRDVRQLLERFRKKGEPMPIPQACTIVGKVCEALDYAHRKRDARGMPLGIVHRDVSPQNVLVSFEGDTKLIDFGIAKAESRLQRTQAGILKGKFSYMSPEQVRGLPIDHRSDIFAAGVLLWELLCGEKLFTGDSDFAVLEKVRNGAVPSPRTRNPRVSEALEKVVLKALAAEVKDRYQWASELHDALVKFTLIGDIMYGARQLSEWMREEFHVEFAKEQERLRRWLGIADEDIEVTPSDPHRKRAYPPLQPPAVTRPETPRAQSLGGPGEMTPSARPSARPPPPPQADPEAQLPLVQPPTPTGVRGTPTPSQRATPPPGELRAAPRTPLPKPPPPVPPENLSHDLPTQKMDGEALIAAEKALFARIEAERALGRQSLGDSEDESTVNDARLGSRKGVDASLLETESLGFRVIRDDLPPAKPPPPPLDQTPAGGHRPVLGPKFGDDEKTPAAPPDSRLLGPSDPTPASVPSLARPPRTQPPPAQPAAGKVPSGPTLQAQQPKTTPPPAPPQSSGPPVPVMQVRSAGALAGQSGPVDLHALANENTQPLPVQPSAFDVSDGDTAAPRAQRKAGLTKATREPAKAPPAPPASKSRLGLWLGVVALLVTAGLAVALWPSDEAAPGKLVVQVSPSVPADLLVDGKNSGPLPPFVRTLSAGTHKIEVRAGGFKPFTATVQVGASDHKTLDVTLVPVMQVEGMDLANPDQKGGEVVPSKPTRPRWLSGTQGSGSQAQPEKAAAPQEGRPDNKPDKVDNRIDNRPDKGSGKASAPKPVEAGAARPVDAVPPKPPDAPPELAPPPPPKAAAAEPKKPAAPLDPMADPARLRITTTPPGAEVSIDDRPAGQTPLAIERLDLGKVMIVKVTLDGYKPEKRVAKGEDGRFPAFNLTLTPLPPKDPAPQAALPPLPEPDAPVGYLITMTKPIAKVLVDGKDTGRWTPVQPKNPINLPPGAHTVVFETAQGKRFEQQVTIEVGKTTKVIKLDL
jgi:serine/threonine protein kinase